MIQGVSNTKNGILTRKLFFFSYPMHQIFKVVADVENLHKFLPYCYKSEVYDRQKNSFKADLEIGYPPIIQKYTSHVTLQEPHQIKVESYNVNVLKYLKTTWQFSPGLKDIPDSCVIHFNIAFQFKVELYSKLTNLFFDMLVRQMKDSFLEEAKRRYGPPSIETVDLKVLKKDYLKTLLKDQSQ